jgi:hypothetical protein
MIMTIEYGSCAILTERKVKKYIEISKYNDWRRNAGFIEIKATLIPGETASNDTVIIKGKPDEAIKGSQIKSSEQCREFGITWHDSAAAPKETER